MSLFRQNTPKPPAAELLARTEFEGFYRHVTYENEDGTFKVVIFRVGEDEFKAAGNLYGAGSGEPLRIRGKWSEHAKHGWTFQIESFLVQVPTTAEGVLAYLGSGLIKGVGKRTAERIVQHFGDKTLETLDNAPELLAEVQGVSRKLARVISEKWQEHRASREAMMFLKEHGLTTAMALRLIKHYGDNVVAVMRANPYKAGLEVPMVGFLKADEIAEKMGVQKDSPQRLQAAIVHVLDQASTEGHTYLGRDELVTRSSEMLTVDRAAVEGALATVTSQGYLREVTLPGGDTPCYFMPALYACESGCVALIADLIRQSRPLIASKVDERLAEFEKRFRFTLAPQQSDAIRSVVTGGVCVITGGPGTGKTTLVRALMHLVKGHGSIRFALCSPTGRAAQRLSETTGEEAATVHRLLKWNAQTSRFTHGPENKLPVDLLIVDESSMLDVMLAFNVLRSLPMGATVVFVGDVDQLPSVGPGSFLRDLIRSGRAKTTTLQVIFRQAQSSLIIQNSHRINEGHAISFSDKPDENADFFFIDRDEPERIRETLLTMATDRIPRKLGCDPLEDVQVLTPMRRGPLGTAELNLLLQEKLNPGGRRVAAYLPFCIGDKVIQTSNNYDLDVYNGDVGRIASINHETGQVRVQFGKRPIHYPVENLGELELAYAITVHKSQGSEYSAVVVLLHTSHYIMLRRNLLYTAVTRGKKLVVVIGSKRALLQAIRTSSESERMTALEKWLTKPPESGSLI